jgi:phosphosulfolactate synthase
METLSKHWHPKLTDPSMSRQFKPRQTGITMVIDKGMGIHQFKDLLDLAAEYIDYIKIGFGTSAIYPLSFLSQKIELAKAYRVNIMPGGTFLETALYHDKVEHFFETIQHIGFNTIEISNGTISLSDEARKQLIRTAKGMGFLVLSEYGKKLSGSQLEVEELARTLEQDIENGASYVIVEGRESGKNVGVFDQNGNCKMNLLSQVKHLPYRHRLIWEAPLKQQQVTFIKHIGREVNLGNIPPEEVFSLETLRRGLRSDTFLFEGEQSMT